VPRATVPPTLSVRAQQWAAQALGALPPSVQVRLSRKPPVQIDGQTLAPEVQLVLTVLALQREPPLETLSLADAREARRRLTAVYGGKPVPVESIRDLEIDGGEQAVRLRARHYVPPEPGGPHPLLVFYHGGGFTYGDLDTHDSVCRVLCRHAGAHVLAVDYRLAPEHPFPASVDDARAALRWAHANADALGADPARVGVGGDSAGGNLAAVVSQLAAHDGGPAPALQLLIYPVTDVTTRRPSRELFGEGFLLTDPEMEWYQDNYLGSARTHASDPRASPLLAGDLSGLAPAYVVTAGFDPLRDEGEAYAARLVAAGVPASASRYDGMIHAFFGMDALLPQAADAITEAANALRAAMHA
jgi:acetyl esterase